MTTTQQYSQNNLNTNLHSTFVDFTDEDNCPPFPFPDSLADADKEDKQKFIYLLIQKCWENPNILFSSKLPEFNAEVFKITKKDIEAVKALYKEQCPVIFNSMSIY